MTPLNIVFLGTPDFAVLPLKALFDCENAHIVAVMCNKDKPVGRKQILTPPPVKIVAEKLGIPVYQYDKIRVEGVKDIKALAPDLMVTCAFGQILSQEILDVPRFGVINIHASLLPKYRGASPIHYAILNGETETGVTVMKTDAGLDTGDIMFSKKTAIGERETCGELFERLSVLGAECAVQAVKLIAEGKAIFTPQDEKNATYSKIIKKEDAVIDWNASAQAVVNKIRAFCPLPAAYTYLNGEPFKIYSAEAVKADFENVYPQSKAGEVVSNVGGGITVLAGDGGVKFLKVCKAGGKPMPIRDFLLGNKLPIGTLFGETK